MDSYGSNGRVPTARTVEISDDDMLYCKYCYEEFNTSSVLKAHENEFHQVPSQEKTILEETERYVKISTIYL